MTLLCSLLAAMIMIPVDASACHNAMHRDRIRSMARMSLASVWQHIGEGAYDRARRALKKQHPLLEKFDPTKSKKGLWGAQREPLHALAVITIRRGGDIVWATAVLKRLSIDANSRIRSHYAEALAHNPLTAEQARKMLEALDEFDAIADPHVKALLAQLRRGATPSTDVGKAG